jgi:hypothetical protein
MNQIKKDIIEILSKGKVTKYEIKCLMSDTRKLLEYSGQKSKHPHLLLFCDWLVHSEMDRNNAIYDILEKASIVLKDGASKNPVIILHRFSNEALNFRKFRIELLSFYKSQNIPIANIFSDPKAWKSFIACLALSLLEVPLKYPDDIESPEFKGRHSSKKRYDATRKMINDDMFFVTKIILDFPNEIITTNEVIPNKSINFTLKTRGGFSLSGNLKQSF